MSRRTNVEDSFILSMFYAGLIGGLTGLIIVRLVLSSHGIADVLIDYVKYLSSIIISLVLIKLLFRYVHGYRKIVVGNVWRIVKIVLLLDFFAILLSIVYILSFNLLDMCCYRNPLLLFCSNIGGNRGLSNSETLVIACVFIGAVVAVNLYAVKVSLRSPQLRMRRIIGLPRKIVCFIIALITIIVVIPSYMYLSIDSKYAETLSDLKRYIVQCNTTNSSISCLWNFVLHYKGEFIGTYRKPCPKPKQLLIRLPPLIDNKDFVAKLAAVSRTGACFDFAIGVTKVIRDIYGYKTRVVVMVGWDHVIPEVEVNGTWYVIDAVYTTAKNPIKVSNYAEYLRQHYSEVYNNLKGLIDFDSGKDLSKDHGLRK